MSGGWLGVAEDSHVRKTALERELLEVRAVEEQLAQKRYSSEAKFEELRAEVHHVRSAVERAKSLRRVCDRLSSVDGKLQKAPHTRQYQRSHCAAAPMLDKQTMWLVAAAVATLGFAFLLTGGSKHICHARPAAKWQNGKWQGSADDMFSPTKPPLMIDGSPDVTRSHAVRALSPVLFTWYPTSKKRIMPAFLRQTVN
jgi:hypothetical protein